MAKGGEKAEISDTARLEAVRASQLFDLTNPMNQQAMDAVIYEMTGYAPPERSAAAEGDTVKPNTVEDLQRVENMWQNADGSLKDVATDVGADVKRQLGAPSGSALGVGNAMARFNAELAAGRAEGGVKAGNRVRQVQTVNAIAARGVGREAVAAQTQGEIAARETQSALAGAQDAYAANIGATHGLQNLGRTYLGYRAAQEGQAEGLATPLTTPLGHPGLR